MTGKSRRGLWYRDVLLQTFFILFNTPFAISFISSTQDEGPKFVEVFTPRDLVPGEWLSLKCTAIGVPLPQITWSLDGFPLDSLDNLRTGDYVTNENLVISFVNISYVKPEHGGTYTCRAANEVGSTVNSAFIKVTGDPIVRSMSNLTTIAHEDLTLKCPVGGDPIDEIYWEKNGIRLPDNHRQVVHSNGTLIMKEVVRESDEGHYICTASNKRGTSSRSGINVIIRVRPVIEPFIMPHSVQMGQRLSITCTVIKGDPPINIKWMKDEIPLNEDSASSSSSSAINQNSFNSIASQSIRIHHLADYSSTLLFESVKPGDRGNYTCVASNNVGQDVHTAQMVIYVPPKWVTEPVDSSPIKGDSVHINCQATGHPPPKVVWKKSTTDKSSSTYKHVTSSFRTHILENGTLFIDDVQKSDSGLYLCRASNGIGTDLSKVIRVSVHESAHFKSRFRAETFRTGDPGRVTCEAFGDRPIKIDWMKDNQLLVFDPGRIYFKDTIVNERTISELNIKSIEKKDYAIYSCRASNAYGSDETSIQVIVQEPAHFKSKFRAETFRKGDPARVLCEAFGDRPIKIEWLKDNQPVMFDSERIYFKDTIVNEGTISELNIKSIERMDSALYQCRTSNAFGSDETSIQLIVRDPPTAPVLKVTSTTTSTINLSWTVKSSEENFLPITGYTLYHRKHDNSNGESVRLNQIQSQHLRTPGHHSFSVSNGPSLPTLGYDWNEIRLSGDHSTHSFDRLSCGSKYQFYIVAMNSIGQSDASEIVIIRTDGSQPVPPDKFALLRVNSTAVNVMLSAWHDGNCPIASFELSYKPRRPLPGNPNAGWESFGMHPGSSRSVVIRDLIPSTIYDLKITATNDAGSTESQYNFATPEITDDALAATLPSSLNLLEMTVSLILPTTISIVLLIIMVLSTRIWIIRKRHANDQAFECQAVYDGKQNGGETLCMSGIGPHYTLQKTIIGSPGDGGQGNCGSASVTHHESNLNQQSVGHIYPNPYDVTKLSVASGNHHVINGNGMMETLKGQHTTPLKSVSLDGSESMYATVKRSGRNLRDVHIYQYPCTINRLTGLATITSEGCESDSCLSLNSLPAITTVGNKLVNGTSTIGKTAFIRVRAHSPHRHDDHSICCCDPNDD